MEGNIMKRFALFAFAFAGVAACDAPPVPTAPTTSALQVPTHMSSAQVLNDKIDISGTVFNDCPPAEPVAFTGSIHVLATGTLTPTNIDAKVHENTQGISGVGLVTGDRYSVLENVNEDFVASGSLVNEFLDVRLRLVRQGSLDNLWIRQTVRVTSPPFHIEFIRNEIECRG
jgi:hypothetical protein